MADGMPMKQNEGNALSPKGDPKRGIPQIMFTFKWHVAWPRSDLQGISWVPPDPLFGDGGKLGRGDDTVGNPHRAQFVQFELFELILLWTSDEKFPVDRFEATVSQSTVTSPLLETFSRSGTKWMCIMYMYVYIYIYIYTYTHICMSMFSYVWLVLLFLYIIVFTWYIYIYIYIYCIYIYTYAHVLREALQEDIEWSETTTECPKDASSYLLPISRLTLSLLTLLDSNFPGNPLWAWEFHPLALRLCLSQTLWNPPCW